RKVGSRGKAICFSFHPRKILTSIPSHEKVVVQSKTGDIQIVEIGHFTKNDWHGYSCLAFDRLGKLGFRPITGFITHPCNEELLKIKVQGGKEVSVTTSHSLFVLRDGEIKAVAASELSVSDYVVCPRRLSQWNRGKQKIILVEPLKSYLKRYGICRKNERLWLRKEERDALNSAREPLAIQNPDDYVIGSHRFKIRPVLDVGEELAEFLGYFAAKGSFGNGLTFSLGPDEMGL